MTPEKACHYLTIRLDLAESTIEGEVLKQWGENDRKAMRVLLDEVKRQRDNHAACQVALANLQDEATRLHSALTDNVMARRNSTGCCDWSCPLCAPLVHEACDDREDPDTNIAIGVEP